MCHEFKLPIHAKKAQVAQKIIGVVLVLTFYLLSSTRVFTVEPDHILKPFSQTPITRSAVKQKPSFSCSHLPPGAGTINTSPDSSRLSKSTRAGSLSLFQSSKRD